MEKGSRNPGFSRMSFMNGPSSKAFSDNLYYLDPFLLILDFLTFKLLSSSSASTDTLLFWFTYIEDYSSIVSLPAFFYNLLKAHEVIIQVRGLL